MRMLLLAGRDVADSDRAPSPRVMVINKTLAREFFGEENPMGQSLAVDMGEPIVHEVVGVAGDARLSTVQDGPYHTTYFAFGQVPMDMMRLAVRTQGDPAALTAPIRSLLRAKDRNIPLAEPATRVRPADALHNE